MSKTKTRIISFDGVSTSGGVELFTSSLLLWIEYLRPGFLARSHVHCGVSAGSMVAMMLAHSKNTEEVLKATYIATKANIFNQTPWRKLTGYLGLTSLFPQENLTETIPQLEGLSLGDLYEISQKNICVPVVDLWAPPDVEGDPHTAKPVVFRNFGENSHSDYQSFDVLKKSSVVPVIFENYKQYADGAFAAANPSLFAIQTVMNHLKNPDPPEQEDLVVFSMGNGMVPFGVDIKEGADWGFQKWMSNRKAYGTVVDLFLHMNLSVTDFHCREIIGDRYLRVNPYIKFHPGNFLKAFFLADVEPAYDFMHETVLKFISEGRMQGILDWLDENWFKD